MLAGLELPAEGVKRVKEVMPKLVGGAERQEVPFLPTTDIAVLAAGKAKESSRKLRRETKAKRGVRGLDAMAAIEERRAKMQGQCGK
jgi:hypothetical protein